jgi:small GTP-binding protein
MFDDKDFETLKIVLIGESAVGKTSLISQFIDQVFQDDQQSTIGGTFSTKIIKCGNGKILKLEIWDTAGQERYRSVTKLFYKDANAALLVYDISNKYTFEELQNYWIDQVRDSAPKDIILAIVANKSDLIESEQVDEAMAREFAKDNGALFALTSAKTTAGVESLFLDIAKKYTGTDSASTIESENKKEEEEYKKIRKDSVKITKQSQVKAKKKKCC